MIFEQVAAGGCQSYLVGCPETLSGVLIDPEISQIDRYKALAARHGLHIRYVVDTHTHADHFSASRDLARRFGVPLVMHRLAPAPHADLRLDDGDMLAVGNLRLRALHTPGHTRDSMCLVMDDRVFTGDTLLIGGTGRTDLPTGDPHALYESLFDKLLKLPAETLVFPAHDYKGDTVSTIGEEKAFNPRLRVQSVDAYIALMNGLNLPNPKMMDVAIPANMRVGLAQDEVARRGWAVGVDEAIGLLGRADVVLIDLREKGEREKHGVIPGSLHAPYPDLRENISRGGMLHELAAATSKRLLFYCAFGERSAMAVQAAQSLGLTTACHLTGGIDAWQKGGGPLTCKSTIKS